MAAKDEYKQKFRPDDAKLDREVDSALEGVSLDALYGFDKPQLPQESSVKGVRRGRVISVDAAKDEVFVDFGGKSQGVAPFSQFETEPKVGDVMEFSVDRYDPNEGLLLLNRKGAAASNVSWENLEIGQIVEGVVTGVNKGGIELQIKNMRAFMPAGQVDIYFNPDLSTLIGQKLKCEVTQFDAHAKNLIVSRRNILEREKEESKQKMLSEIAEGQIRRGTIRSIMDYGAFVDLGGMDGLLHVSEISHKRGIKVSDVLKIGDLVDVKIVKFDRQTGKLSLSLKQTGPDPWATAAERYPVGMQITGRVSKVESFGAFIEVEEGLEGLLPVSELSYTRVKHPSDMLKEGDTLRLVVLSSDPANRKISFSLKQAGPDPWKQAEERYPKNTVAEGKVTRTVDFGAFVELETGLEGLVHISELASHRVKSAADVVKPGDTVRVVVLEVDGKARRISLSMKQATEAMAAEAQAAAAAATPAKPRKKQQLRGGLDWNW
ncbi:MAG TPA: S1 RNA-binding domain-containing protein [Tepidisphaeraceae bacterium]|nr:S1 RNA-binding domain-containing protein [Tepidisphaeraceae bacterium]